MKEKIVGCIPNLFTLLNMSLGLSACLVLIQLDDFDKGLVVPLLILIGGISDFFDGFLARKLNAVSLTGKQLDSFADIITFGVAPLLFINYLCSNGSGLLTMTSSLIYMLAAAYRLARFNLSEKNNYFTGLPITAAGLILVLYALVYGHFFSDGFLMTPFLIIFLSVLMVSKKRVFLWG